MSAQRAFLPVDAAAKRYCRGCRRMMPAADFGTIPIKANGATIRLGRCKACTGKARARSAR